MEAASADVVAVEHHRRGAMQRRRCRQNGHRQPGLQPGPQMRLLVQRWHRVPHHQAVSRTTLLGCSPPTPVNYATS